MNIFVFGSNLAGRHGKGAALHAARQHGAQYGIGIGLTGNAYAIPTKDERLRVLPLDTIAGHIRDFTMFAHQHPEQTFNVTRIGCGLAGYTDDQIAPLFHQAQAHELPNCHFDRAWYRHLYSGFQDPS